MNGPSKSISLGLKPTKRNFTLIEMTIVLGVLSVLIAILFPILRRAQEYARETQCMNNIRQIAVAYNAYMSDYKTDYPMPPSGRFLDDMSIIYPYAPWVFSTVRAPRPFDQKPPRIWRLF